MSAPWKAVSTAPRWMRDVVYCRRCAAVFVSDNRDGVRAAQDHEMDVHPDCWGVTVYERIGCA